MSSYTFSQIPKAEIQRSKFDRSHGHKMAFNSGYLVPFFADEVLPGDTFDLQTSMVARLTTPIVPVMDNIHLDTFFFFVPNRLVWDHWKNFMGEQKNPSDSTDYLVPVVNMVGDDGESINYEQSTFDYMGIPPKLYSLQSDGSMLRETIDLTGDDRPIALPFRAINLIWNEWFRDQNLQNSKPVPTGDGPDDGLDYVHLLRRGKRHDYFTSALPWPQKGPAATLPLGGFAPVYPRDENNSFTNGVALRWGTRYGDDIKSYLRQENTNNHNPDLFGVGIDASRDAQSYPFYDPLDNSNTPVVSDKYLNANGIAPRNLFADLNETTAVTINSMRQAFQLQKFMETAARSGTRYTEIIRGFFNTVSPDYRLQRPEYLGGTSDYITMHQVAQTASTDSTTPQGNLAAYGYSSSVRHGFTKSFTEHGWIIGFVNVWCDLSYQQGMRKELSRKTKLDYYWPQFAHLGEQVVNNREIYLSNNSEANAAVFGYQERYAEYRYHPSMISGRMRSSSEASLDVWHLAQHFDNRPTLGTVFIEEDPPLERVLAVQNEPQILLDAWFDLKCTRPMPLFGVPGLGLRV